MHTLIPIIGAVYSTGGNDRAGVAQYRLCEYGEFVLLDFGIVRLMYTPEGWMQLAEREGHTIISKDVVITVCPACLTFYVTKHHCSPVRLVN